MPLDQSPAFSQQTYFIKKLAACQEEIFQIFAHKIGGGGKTKEKRGGKIMTNRDEMQEKREAVNKFRFEMAEDMSLPISYGYGHSYGMGLGLGEPFAGGYTGEYLVRRMIEAQEKQMQNQGK